MKTTHATTSRLRRSGLNRSVVGAAAIGSMGTALQTVQGAIVYSGLQNLSTSTLIGTAELPDVELVTLGSQSNKAEDFTLMSYTNKGYDIHFMLATFRFDHFTPIINTSQDINYGVLRSFEKGDVIDSQREFVDQSYGGVDVLSFESNSQWSYGNEGYFGYRFDTLGLPAYYGWGRLDFSADGKVMTLVDWAYEDTGAPIQAGQIPEPTTSLLLAGGLVCAGLWRRWFKRSEV